MYKNLNKHIAKPLALFALFCVGMSAFAQSFENEVKTYKTKYGDLVIKGKFPTVVTFNNKPVSGLFGEATAYIGDPKVFSLQGAEALFFSSSPGSACAAELNFFTAYPSGNFKVGAKGGFGTCGPEVKTTLKDDSIVISVSGFGGDSGGYFLANPSQKKQMDKDAKIKHYWKYQDGVVIPFAN